MNKNIFGAVVTLPAFTLPALCYNKKNRSIQNMISVLVLSILATSHVFAQQTELRQKQYNLSKSNLAIEGYDPVAYFKANKAIEGKKDISTVYAGVTYHFATTEDRDAFIANPSKYEPQYGGWCAYAMGAKGEKVEVDPKTYKIVDGKLYLFYNKFFTNTLKDWNKNETVLKNNADKNWSVIFR